ncbi:BspA family leucine-rich repeat surface protein [Helicobacter typhlonius]|uniref:BspA family leucine-rich repeat surface protein n=1 Tax=Helicobacter typhlonius TaxID=76936 RepID=UPI002FE2FCA3
MKRQIIFRFVFLACVGAVAFGIKASRDSKSLVSENVESVLLQDTQNNIATLNNADSTSTDVSQNPNETYILPPIIPEVPLPEGLEAKDFKFNQQDKPHFKHPYDPDNYTYDFLLLELKDSQGHSLFELPDKPTEMMIPVNQKDNEIIYATPYFILKENTLDKSFGVTLIGKNEKAILMFGEIDPEETCCQFYSIPNGLEFSVDFAKVVGDYFIFYDSQSKRTAIARILYDGEKKLAHWWLYNHGYIEVTEDFEINGLLLSDDIFKSVYYDGIYGGQNKSAESEESEVMYIAIDNKGIFHPKDKYELYYLLTSENIDFKNIDTSNITNMSFLYVLECELDYGDFFSFWGCMRDKNAPSFQPSDFSHFDVSNVTDMSYMFAGVTWEFDGLNEWDTSKVESMEGMFANASAFNAPLDKWNVSNVKNMQFMFTGAISFNQPLNAWNVSNVKNMSEMFWNAESFNQPLNQWNVENVVNMTYIFKNASTFNQDLNMWKVSRMLEMEYNCDCLAEETFKGTPLESHLPNWVYKLTEKEQAKLESIPKKGIIYYPQDKEELILLLRQPIRIALDHIDTSAITDMAGLFSEYVYYRHSGCQIQKWNVSNVKTMRAMFKDVKSLNCDLSGWDISNVEDMSEMFENTSMSFSLEQWGEQLKSNVKQEAMFKNTPLESNLPQWYRKK